MQSFQQIDKRRAEAAVPRKALYERAGIHKETWRRLSSGTSLGTVRTLTKLTDALEELVREKGKANG